MPHKDLVARADFYKAWREKRKAEGIEQALARTRYAKRGDAAREYFRAWRARQGTWGGQRMTQRLKRHGLTLDQYHAMQERQDFTCAICDKVPKPYAPSMHVDHCHHTGRIRGLLCTKCNVGLGLFKDDPLLLKRALSYLDHRVGHD